MKKLCSLFMIAALVAVDQFIKLWALDVLQPVGRIAVIPRLFYLTYVENRGAAFGIFQGRITILSILAGVLLAIILAALLLDKFKTNFLFWTVSVGVAGGIGNLYDRIARGFVVDYLDFSVIFGFPVFNLADCLVVCATILVLIYFLRTDIAEKKKRIPEPGEGGA